jgi:hypothetical protein
MKFCKKFLKKPSTRKALQNVFEPYVLKTMKYLQKKSKVKLSKEKLQGAVDNMLKITYESFDKSFMKSCDRLCKEFENTPYPCGPENEKVMLKNIQNINQEELTNNTIRRLKSLQTLKRKYR